MQKPLEQLSLAALATLYNKHAAKPVKKFASRKDALRRVRAVMDAAQRAKAATAGRTKEKAPAADRLRQTLASGPRTVEQIKGALGLDSEHAARMAIDRARRAGLKVHNVAKGTFSLNKKEE